MLAELHRQRRQRLGNGCFAIDRRTGAGVFMYLAHTKMEIFLQLKAYLRPFGESSGNADG